MTRSRLLIIHPEPSALAMLAAMLGPLGHDLIAATCDRVALQILAGRPGLVLIGVDPAEPGARDLLTRFRREYPATPVIVLLTRIHPGWDHQALLWGATMVLRFPLPANQLQAAVIQALDDATVARHGNRHEPERPVGEPPVQPERRPESMRAASPCTCSCGARPIGEAVGDDPPLRPLKEALEIPEREIILRALRACGGSRHETAKALDINRTTLYKKMKKYQLLAEDD